MLIVGTLNKGGKTGTELCLGGDIIMFGLFTVFLIRWVSISNT